MTLDQETFAYIGNWDVRKLAPPNGIGICRYDAHSGRLQLLKNVFPTLSVGAACVNSRRDVLYCTDECTTLPGYFLGGGGQVYALAIDPTTGDLSEINHQPSYGTLPSSLVIAASDRYLVVTHHTDRVPVTKIIQPARAQYRIALEYDDACTVLFPLSETGAIGDPHDVYTHAGGGGPLARQTHPQLHSVTSSPCGRLFAVCDKGNDEIVLFRIDRAGQRLVRCADQGFKTFPGSSPRYSAFHPTRPFLFVNHETQALLSVLRYDDAGRLDPVCSVRVVAVSVADDATVQQSDLKVHPSGNYLYTLSRGLNAVLVFAIDALTGALQPLQSLTLDGSGPRGCVISADGRFLHVAALTSHEVLSLSIAADGTLAPSGARLQQPHPGNITLY